MLLNGFNGMAVRNALHFLPSSKTLIQVQFLQLYTVFKRFNIMDIIESLHFNKEVYQFTNVCSINAKRIKLTVCVLMSVTNRPPHSIETLSAAAEKASGIPAYLPNCLLLKDTIRKASEWLQEADELQVRTQNQIEFMQRLL